MDRHLRGPISCWPKGQRYCLRVLRPVRADSRGEAMGHNLPLLRGLHPLASFRHGVLWPADEKARA
jgi:hypothetical protein